MKRNQICIGFDCYFSSHLEILRIQQSNNHIHISKNDFNEVFCKKYEKENSIQVNFYVKSIFICYAFCDIFSTVNGIDE